MDGRRRKTQCSYLGFRVVLGLRDCEIKSHAGSLPALIVQHNFVNSCPSLSSRCCPSQTSILERVNWTVLLSADLLMARRQTIISRTPLLANSAAEFVKTRAGPAIIARISEGDEESETEPPEFVSELDRFVPKGQVPKYGLSPL